MALADPHHQPFAHGFAQELVREAFQSILSADYQSFLVPCEMLPFFVTDVT